MKKINRRAFSVLLIALAVIFGLGVYILRYIDHGQDWALYFSRANSGSTGELTDRNGVLLASFPQPRTCSVTMRPPAWQITM